MATAIIKTKNGFEAIGYISLLERPLNIVLEVPDNSANDKNNFYLVDTDVEVSWNNYYGTSRWNIVEVRYRKNLIYEINRIKNVQVVLDVLNKFSNMTKSELEKILLESQEKEKTALEIAIEELKAEKTKLEEQMQIYKAIQTKKEEIKLLLNKLDE